VFFEVQIQGKYHKTNKNVFSGILSQSRAREGSLQQAFHSFRKQSMLESQYCDQNRARITIEKQQQERERK